MAAMLVGGERKKGGRFRHRWRVPSSFEWMRLRQAASTDYGVGAPVPTNCQLPTRAELTGQELTAAKATATKPPPPAKQDLEGQSACKLNFTGSFFLLSQPTVLISGPDHPAFRLQFEGILGVPKSTTSANVVNWRSPKPPVLCARAG